MKTLEDAITSLGEELTRCVKEHSPFGDSLFHNGGTVIALAATGTATLLPSSMSTWARIAAAVATFVIALSRALDFGGRWRWHIQMRNAYMALLDRVNGLDVYRKRNDPKQPRRSSRISPPSARRRTAYPALGRRPEMRSPSDAARAIRRLSLRRDRYSLAQTGSCPSSRRLGHAQRSPRAAQQ